VVWYRRRGPGSEEVAATASDSTDGSAPPPAAADTNGESDGEPEPLSDEELMTDEDRVVTLIQENGGRMKQVNIVEETGWSKSKVSMLLSDMEDDGTISKLRVGRENIISLEDSNRKRPSRRSTVATTDETSATDPLSHGGDRQPRNETES